jgi:hypothetical protein
MFQPMGDKCQLRVKSVDPSVHYGQWRCQASSWGVKGVAKVHLGQIEPAAVELVDEWGKVILEMGE